MKLLVCGGAGYIGSHMVRLLQSNGHEVVVFDNLSTGHRQSIKRAELVVGDLLCTDQLNQVFSAHAFDAVFHFAALSLVGESVADPYRYYSNNVAGSLNLLAAMRQANVNRLVFSSTAAVFGHPQSELIDESHPVQPINPYGASKLMIEWMLRDAASAYGLRSVALRYFNAAGAAEEGDLGEAHEPETHLIPNVLRSALGVGGSLKVFGIDYPTPDGTCIRDYIHVNDLADAHLKALEYMASVEGAHAFNLGNGCGFSVLEIIEAARRVTTCDIRFEVASRRAGDPARLVASSSSAQKVLGWRPRFDRIDDIIATAWRWHQYQIY